MPLPTTRRERFLWRKKRYQRKAQRADTWKYLWGRDGAGNAKRFGIKPWFVVGPKQGPCAVSSASYDAALDIPFGLPIAFQISAAGNFNPPHITITSPWYAAFRATGWHHRFPFLRYHAKRMRAYRRLSSVKRSKRDRQITGCNWFYFRNGFYMDDDVLGRHPNQTDVENGDPPGSTLWPEPLGY